MRALSIILTYLILACAVPAMADVNGFRGFTWGADEGTIRESYPKLVEGMMGAMPGVKAYRLTDEELNFGGINADAITYFFYKGKFTSVSIDFRGFDNFERLLVYCKKSFGQPTGSAVLRLEQYAEFDSPNTGAMLLYQLSMQTSNYGRLYLFSKKFLD